MGSEACCGKTLPCSLNPTVCELVTPERPNNLREWPRCKLSEASFTGDVEINHRPDPEIYGRLINECTYLGLEGEFSICFSEPQQNFLKDRPPKLKNLIRLVKHWYQLVWRLDQPL
ncbi:2'-5'-oligoadenylate synthetase 1A [Cricetulus griseus]|uniref:2'-5'-oligoadenylate synthetase 1A n=1 Tax=Cricetulus griseus TaxID=10029 RepID=G3IPD8_CRIGR|nr:2'-5'-oligoadenylate synthetase 1A [Cricetulus griseus]